VSREEARKLLGGYATGSLTEAERRGLFEAALEDQELFEELAGEQVLKAVLDEPGARQRLISALEPPRHRAWLWGWAGAIATVAVAVAVGIVLFNRTSPPQPATQQIAQAVRPPEPEVAPAAPPARRQPAVRKVSPPPPTAQTPAELRKEEALADQLQQVQPQAAAEAPRGFVAGGAAPTASRRAQNETVTVTTEVKIYFSYAVRADGSLRIAIVEPGFLSVTALTKTEVDIFPSAAVSPSTTIRLQIPSDATGVVIGFSKTPGTNYAPIEQVAAEGFGTSLGSTGKIRIQPTPLFLKLETR